MTGRLLDMDGLAEYFGVSPETVKAWVKQRLIPLTRLPGGRQVRFTPEQVAQILAAGEELPINGPMAVPRLRSVHTRKERVA